MKRRVGIVEGRAAMKDVEETREYFCLKIPGSSFWQRYDGGEVKRWEVKEIKKSQVVMRQKKEE
jgi:hypothetical protein